MWKQFCFSGGGIWPEPEWQPCGVGAPGNSKLSAKCQNFERSYQVRQMQYCATTMPSQRIIIDPKPSSFTTGFLTIPFFTVVSAHQDWNPAGWGHDGLADLQPTAEAVHVSEDKRFGLSGWNLNPTNNFLMGMQFYSLSCHLLTHSVRNCTTRISYLLQLKSTKV